jgi:uncharacterized membrane protein YhaH (DUF805 family)
MLGSSMMPFTMGDPGRSFDQTAWMAKRQEVQLAVSLITLWPALAVGIKRQHDRGRQGWWFVLLCVLSAADQGLSLVANTASAVLPIHPTELLLLLGFVILVIGVWQLVELGFLDGTHGSNDYGPSPKGP